MRHDSTRGHALLDGVGACPGLETGAHRGSGLLIRPYGELAATTQRSLTDPRR